MAYRNTKNAAYVALSNPGTWIELEDGTEMRVEFTAPHSGLFEISLRQCLIEWFFEPGELFRNETKTYVYTCETKKSTAWHVANIVWDYANRHKTEKFEKIY